MVNGGTVCLMDGMVFVGTLWKLMEKYQASSMALSPASLGMIFKLSGEQDRRLMKAGWIISRSVPRHL